MYYFIFILFFNNIRVIDVLNRLVKRIFIVVFTILIDFSTYITRR